MYGTTWKETFGCFGCEASCLARSEKVLLAAFLNRMVPPGSSGYISGAMIKSAGPKGCKDMNKLNRLETLRCLYRSTFEEWASQIGQLDEIRDSAQEGHGLREAQQRTAQAEAGYRGVRNRLVEEMAAGAHS